MSGVKIRCSICGIRIINTRSNIVGELGNITINYDIRKGLCFDCLGRDNPEDLSFPRDKTIELPASQLTLDGLLIL